MGRSALENFHRRFGNPPRIDVKFTDIESEPDKDYLYDKIFDAWVDALRSLLGREPSQDEIFGLKSIRNEIENNPGGGKDGAKSHALVGC